MSEEMEKMKYDEFLKTIVECKYNTIGMGNDLLENGKKPTFKIVLTRNEWVAGYNSQTYQTKTYYYDFEIDNIVDLIFDLLGTQNEDTKNRILRIIKRNNDDLLKELER